MKEASETAGFDPSTVSRLALDELGQRRFDGVAKAVFTALTIGAVLVAFNEATNWFDALLVIDRRYTYLVAMLLLPLTFMAFPLTKSHQQSISWHDYAFAAIAFGCGLYCVFITDRIISEGWEYEAPLQAMVVSVIYAVIILEGLRRSSGLVITIICSLAALYPVVAAYMPGPFAGIETSLQNTLLFQIMGGEGAFGLPMRTFSEIVLGFLIFGVTLNHTGGGAFFNDLAFLAVGRLRGGAAQVGVVSSMLQGSISGSVISNVFTSGVVTIPAMKRSGFTAAYAGGVEAVASTGAMLMPPVMGSAAFLMSAILDVPYGEVVVAAFIPALLFYFGLSVQIDAYSARHKLAGLAPSELPKAGKVFREGWMFVFAFALLIWMLLDSGSENLAPYAASGLLLIINQIRPANRMTLARFYNFIVACGRAFASIIALMMAIGFIVGTMTVTGLAATLVNDLIKLAGGVPILLLLVGAVISFILGMGMTISACYIFLAVTLAPPLVQAGLDPLAVHLFIMYWGMISFITPPVAIASFAAATLAKASPFKVCFESMRLGSVLYFVPFFFVLNPALIMHGTPFNVISSVVTAVIGVWLLAAGLQGYLIGCGSMNNSVSGIFARIAILLAGSAFVVPGLHVYGLGNWELALIAVPLTFIGGFLILRTAASDRKISEMNAA
ncbi:MAG: TRAP transporter fused permease subunit [Pseudolabrys sp.]|nr:TRAP transporter fused permease subunit [Pseudolabrys sp.]